MDFKDAESFIFIRIFIFMSLEGTVEDKTYWKGNKHKKQQQKGGNIRQLMSKLLKKRFLQAFFV